MESLAKLHLRQTKSIALVTFRDLIRQKILWSAMFFAFLAVALAYAVSQLSFAENARIALDFGLTSISLIGSLISIVMGSTLIAKEIENRTLYLILTKAVQRWQFIVGRFVGLLSVLFVNTVLMTTVLVGLYKFLGGHLDLIFLKSLLLQFCEFGILAGIAIIFSSFSTSVFAAIVSSAVWIIGHAMTDLKIVASKAEGALKPFLSFLTNVFPDLTQFDIKIQVAHSLPVTLKYTAAVTVYGLTYMLFSLAISCLIFSKRDL